MKNIKEFLKIKENTEKRWKNIQIDKNIYGFQIQKGTKWNKGLSEKQLVEFQNIMGFEFPEILIDYYTVMNGVDREQINIYANSGESYSYSKNIYTFPDDINIIIDLIKNVYIENDIDENEMLSTNISRIFPIYYNKFILIDHGEHPILSIQGNDIILYSNSIIDLFYTEALGKKLKINNNININYWLDL